MLKNIAVFFVFFVSVQRFEMAPVNAWVCFVPLMAAVYFLLSLHIGKAMTCLALALLCTVDLGGEIYTETPRLLRFAVYLAVLTALVLSSSTSVRRPTLMLASIYVFMLIVGAASSLDGGLIPYNTAALSRDVFVLLLIGFVVLAGRPSEFLDLKLLAVAGLGHLAGELVNIAIFFKYENDYLSYSSLKIFIFFPAIFALMEDKYRKWAPILFGLAILVAVFYASRMILLSFLSLFFVALLIRFVSRIRFRRLTALAIPIICASAIWATGVFQDDLLVQYRVTAVVRDIVELFSSQDSLSVLQALDRVRYGEHVLFFNRPAIEILFGSGLGAGLHDSVGELAYLPIDAQQAFTAAEIASGSFFNLHDFWIDFGLRFGLLAIFYIAVILIYREMRLGFSCTGLWFGLLLINSTFSTAGLLLITVMYIYWPENRRAPAVFLGDNRGHAIKKNGGEIVRSVSASWNG
jgi:hypothetical protein